MSSQCGTLGTAGITMVDFSQLVGDQTVFRKGGARIWQSFRNNDSPLQNVQLNAPGAEPCGVHTADHRGHLRCELQSERHGHQGRVRLPHAVPGLRPRSRSVRASKGEDCGPNDTVPGNQQCDLPPGVYGNFSVRERRMGQPEQPATTCSATSARVAAPR